MVEHSRGKIRNPDAARRLRDFSGLRYGRITPTDIDLFLEFGDAHKYIIGEGKAHGAELPFGQQLALERMADDLNSSRPTLLIIVDISDDMPDMIPYHLTVVRKSRENGEWNNRYVGMTTRQAIDEFVGWHESDCND